MQSCGDMTYGSVIYANPEVGMSLASPYLRQLCCSSMQIQRRCYLHSAELAELAFSITISVTWNWFPTILRQVPVGHTVCFFTTLKTVLCDWG